MQSKIVTKAGDTGRSSTQTKSNLKKSSAVFEILGELDELSSILGFVANSKTPVIKVDVSAIQSQLMYLGSLYAGSKIKVSVNKFIDFLEKRIDFYEAKNTPLKNFIFPSGVHEACYLFLARAVCRRLERIAVKNKSKVKVTQGKDIFAYLNRLSDTLFVMARYVNKIAKVKEKIWSVGR